MALLLQLIVIFFDDCDVVAAPVQPTITTAEVLLPCTFLSAFLPDSILLFSTYLLLLLHSYVLLPRDQVHVDKFTEKFQMPPFS